MRLKLLLEYDGARFAGWQAQRGRLRTVQGEVVRALAALPGAWGAVQGAGRTDAGAHAEGQVVSCDYEGPLTVTRLRAAINAHLPEDVAVLEVAEAPPDFHARYSAIARHYRYRYLDRPARPVLDRGRCWHLRRPLDETAMREALPTLVGRRDWTSLCSAQTDPADREREVLRAGLERRAPFLDLDLWGDGFLRGQVRGIAGALAEIGQGRRPPSWLEELLRARDPSRAARTAPADGLTLVEVRYPEPG